MASTTTEPYVFEKHRFTGRIVGKPYCVGCGLIAANNEFTQWSIDKGCNNEDHPQFQQKRKAAGYGMKAYAGAKR